MRSLLVLALLAVAMVTGQAGLPQQPDDPVVAVLTAPSLGGACTMMPEHHFEAQLDALKRGTPLGKKIHKAQKKQRATVIPAVQGSGSNSSTGSGGCLWSIYVDWLQSSGFRVMPLKWDAPRSEILATVRQANALLFPGGVLSRATELYKDYFGRMCDIYDLVKADNDLDNKVALWGTCEGFQMIGACAAGRNVSILWSPYRGTSPKMLANNFTKYTSTSKMLGTAIGGITGSGAPSNVVHWMHTEPTTLNWHHLGIPPAQFVTNPVLNASGLVPIATTNDIDGNTFVSMYEMSGSRANIFGVQFHPERVMFELDNRMITHQDHAIQFSEYLGLFLVTRARMNSNSFGFHSVVEPKLINNYTPVNMGGGIRIYYV